WPFPTRLGGRSSGAGAEWTLPASSPPTRRTTSSRGSSTASSLSSSRMPWTRAAAWRWPSGRVRRLPTPPPFETCDYVSLWPAELADLVNRLGAGAVYAAGLRSLGYPAILASAQHEFEAVRRECTRGVKDA